MKSKQGISVLFCLLFCLCMLPVTAFAAAPTESWSESAAESFAGGTGTKDDPYQIATAGQLAKLAEDINAGTGTVYNGVYFELTANIDLSGKLWEPIGYIGSDTGWYVSFCGYFNGNGHTIEGMYVDPRGRKSTAGLFGCVSACSTEPVIQNLTVEGEVYAGEALSNLDNPAAGILAGDVTRSAAAAYAVIQNCHVSGSVFSESDYVGGMIGSASRLHISDSSADVDVTGQGCTGGFVGYGFIGKYQNCTASGNVNGTWCVGGFAGQMFGESYITPSDFVSVDHCLASGNVTASDWEAGGFAGYLADTRISSSAAMGEVHSTLTTASPRAGGFVGEVYSDDYYGVVTITDSHAVGKGTVAHNEIPFGGFVGYLSQGTITGCSYDGAINDVAAVAETEADGTLEIEKGSTETALGNICKDYYGGHQYSTELTVDKQPTCTEDGSQSYHCERCGDKKDSQVIPAIKHDWGEPEWDWSEDYSSAAVTFTCQNDNTHQETPPVTVTSKVVREATCTIDGEKINTASVTFNGETYTDEQKVTIAAAGHQAGTEWKSDGEKHWKECTECGEKLNEADHDGGTATCTEKAVCDICGEEYGEVNASNHTNLVKTEAKPATHMAVGNTEYWHCDGCDKYFCDEAGTQEIALKDTVIPKLTEHTADGTGWHSDETSHWKTCECGEKLNEAAHTFEWVTDQEATATEAGSKHEECTVCGYEKAAVEIPATGTPSDTDTPSGDPTSPETGDNSTIALGMAVLLAAGTALTGTVLYNRKKKYSR